MRNKLTIHFFLSLVLAIIAMFIISIVCIIVSIYDMDVTGNLNFSYAPSELMDEVKDSINLSAENNIYIDEYGVKILEDNNVKLQIIDSNNYEVYSYKKPDDIPIRYSNVTLLEIYNSENKTVYLDEKELGGEIYTYLLFFDSQKIKRLTVTYDEKFLYELHELPIMLGINVIMVLTINLILTLGICFLYSLKITKPINTIINRLVDLSKGKYSVKDVKKGIYTDVESSLNELSQRLYNNELERNKIDSIREEWISNISHDIKTPLTSIRGNSEIMATREYEIDDESRVKYSNIIINKADYIKTLVEDLNLSTRLKSCNIQLNRKPINIISLIRHIIIEFINDNVYEDAYINFICEEEEIIINADENLIKRVFINLIVNAFIHNDYKVTINVSVLRKNKNGVVISICDNGKGVLEEDLKYIFERYYRGTNTRLATEGSGLGMAIAHDIIKAHDGNIDARSNKGEGMVIKIDL